MSAVALFTHRRPQDTHDAVLLLVEMARRRRITLRLMRSMKTTTATVTPRSTATMISPESATAATTPITTRSSAMLRQLIVFLCTTRFMRSSVQRSKSWNPA